MQPALSQIDAAASIEAAEAFRLMGFSRITGWRLIRNPRSGFPRPYRCDPGNPRSRLRFRLCEIIEWIKRQQDATAEAPCAGIHSNRLATRAG